MYTYSQDKLKRKLNRAYESRRKPYRVTIDRSLLPDSERVVILDRDNSTFHIMSPGNG